MIINKKHLTETYSSYAGHLASAIGLSFYLLFLSVVSVVHGLIPFLLTDAVSKGVKRLNKKLNEEI